MKRIVINTLLVLLNAMDGMVMGTKMFVESFMEWEDYD